MLNHQISDNQALGQYFELLGDEGPQFVIEIIDTFLEEAPDNFALLDQSYTTKDHGTFRRAAHTLKTGCSTVGAKELAQAFQELEDAGAIEDLTTVESLLKQCIDDFEILKNELEIQKGSLL